MQPSEVVSTQREQAGLTQREFADLSGVAQSNIAAYESGARRPSPRMLERLRLAARPRPSLALRVHRDELLRLAHAHRAIEVRVFGSVARGEDRPGSDLDLLVRFADGASLFDQVDLAADLEDLLGVGVDVISMGGLPHHHADAVRESVPL